MTDGKQKHSCVLVVAIFLWIGTWVLFSRQTSAAAPAFIWQGSGCFIRTGAREIWQRYSAGDKYLDGLVSAGVAEIVDGVYRLIQ